MALAIALSLVIVVSTATLLYQYWTSALAADDGETARSRFPARPRRPARIDARSRPEGGFRADTAA
jgi:hypothetical protein